MSYCNRATSVVRPSVRPSVRLSVNFCANRFYYHRSGWIATKLAHDGPQTVLHPGCAQGQGQGLRSRDTGTSVISQNVCYTVRSHVLSLHALTFYMKHHYNVVVCSSSLGIGLRRNVFNRFYDIINGKNSQWLCFLGLVSVYFHIVCSFVCLYNLLWLP